jgi:hypothetical protein
MVWMSSAAGDCEIKQVSSLACSKVFDLSLQMQMRDRVKQLLAASLQL